MSDPRPRDLERILELLDGLESTERTALIDGLLADADPRTRELVAWASRFRELARTTPLTAPPPLLSQRLMRIPALLRGRVQPVRRLVAAPVLDTRNADSLTGVRAPAHDAGERFQVTHRAEGIDVVVDVSPDGPHLVTLRGQVLPERQTLPAFEATVYGPYGSITSILGDEFGSFELGEVPRQTERLELTNDLVVIEIPAGSWLGPR